MIPVVVGVHVVVSPRLGRDGDEVLILSVAGVGDGVVGVGDGKSINAKTAGITPASSHTTKTDGDCFACAKFLLVVCRHLIRPCCS